MRKTEYDPKATVGAALVLILLSLAYVALTGGCTTATATKTSNGSTDTITVKAFLSTIADGHYSSAGSNGIVLSVTSATPDQQAIATLAGGVVEISKAAMVFMSRQPTNAPTTTTNAP